MNKKIYGYFNRITHVYDNVQLFDDDYSMTEYNLFLRDRYNALSNSEDTELKVQAKCFADYIIYPKDYDVYFLGDVNLCPVNPIDVVSSGFKLVGNLDDLINDLLKRLKELSSDVESRDSEAV